MTSKNLAGWLHRWALSLQEYDFRVEYRADKENVVADSLSRSSRDVRAGTDVADHAEAAQRRLEKQRDGRQPAAAEALQGQETGHDP